MKLKIKIRYFLLLLLVSFSTVLSKAQTVENKSRKNKNSLLSTYQKVYENCIQIGDEQGVVYALNVLCALNPKDTSTTNKLLEMYFKQKNYPVAEKFGKLLLENERNNVFYLDIIGQSLENQDKYGEAKISYEKLYYLTSNPYYGYLTAFCEYELFHMVECRELIDELLKSNQLDKHGLTIKLEDGSEQSVPLKAGLYNLRGLVLIDMKKYTEGIRDFEQALIESPEFTLPKNNLTRTKEIVEKIVND